MAGRNNEYEYSRGNIHHLSHLSSLCQVPFLMTGFDAVYLCVIYFVYQRILMRFYHLDRTFTRWHRTRAFRGHESTGWKKSSISITNCCLWCVVWCSWNDEWQWPIAWKWRRKYKTHPACQALRLKCKLRTNGRRTEESPVFERRISVCKGPSWVFTGV